MGYSGTSFNNLTLLGGLVIVVFAWIVRAIYRAYFTTLRGIPGPWYARFTHLWLKLQVLQGCRVHYIHALHSRYGPIVRIAPAEIAISDFTSFKEIHKINSGYLKSVWYEEVTNMESNGIFAIRDPKLHAKRRQLLARGFSKSYLKQNWEAMIREKANVAVGKIKRDALNGTADVLKWWTFYTTDAVGHLSFGESFHMLEHEEKNEYIHALESALFIGGIGAELPWIHFLGRYVPIPSIKKMFRSNNTLLEYGTQAIANAKGSSNSSFNVFSTILAESEKEETNLTSMEVNLEAGNLIVAGSDTTAITLTYLIWAVLKRPQLRIMLEDEVRGLSPEITDADLEKLPLLNAVIEETLRLYGAAPSSLPRVTPPGGSTLCGYFIPGGTTLSTQAYTIHRDASLFPDPDKFDPNRFLDPSVLSANSKAALHAFGAGSRACLGIHLARMELRHATCLFFKECVGARLAEETTDASMEMENYFLIVPKAHKCDITLRV